MLSKYDIENEIIKGGICIVPFDENNLKENSYNLCASKFAWTLESRTIYTNEDQSDFSLTKKTNYQTQVKLNKGDSAVINNQIIILPHSTTVVESAETIGISNGIGGSYHSKVGIVNLGLGHIGTMLGPNFCGDSLIALHNITDEIICLNVGASFVSITFEYLKTPINELNPTTSGQIDKFSRLGISLSSEEEAILNADWKKKREEIYKHMTNEDSFQAFKKEYEKKNKNKWKEYINKKNVITVAIIILFFATIFVLAFYIDQKNNNSTYFTDKAWTILISGIFVFIIHQLLSSIKPRRKN